MGQNGGGGVIMPQTPLIEVAPTRGVHVLGSFEDVAMWALAMRVGVGLRLAVSVDRKKAKLRGCEKPKDVGREERWLSVRHQSLRVQPGEREGISARGLTV